MACHGSGTLVISKRGISLYDRVKTHLMNRHKEAPADQELDFMVLLPQEEGEKDKFNIASYDEVSPARTLHNFSNVL